MATIILYEPRGATPDRAELVQELTACLTIDGHRVLRTPDLYDLPEDSPIWAAIREIEGPAAVLGWLHPRALHWLLERRGVDRDLLPIINLATCASTEEVIQGLQFDEGDGGRVETLPEQTTARWYPVTDLGLCTNCGHCRQFCLFGVYELDEAGQVCVTNPDQCKAGCPACSRICPTSAIMFPLYHQDPAIAGAPDQFVGRDAEARRMFYARAEQPCPLCALKADSEIAGIATDGCCPECGRELDTVELPPSHTLDEIDALIGKLDDLRGGR
ncbi:MAG: hypothetical protein WCP21_04830 [Armatimonadota bacterium]